MLEVNDVEPIAPLHPWDALADDPARCGERCVVAEGDELLLPEMLHPPRTLGTHCVCGAVFLMTRSTKTADSGVFEVFEGRCRCERRWWGVALEPERRGRPGRRT